MKANLKRQIAALCLLAIAVVVLGVVGSAMSKDPVGHRDFIEYWSAGQLLRHGANPYDVEANLRLQQAAGLPGERSLTILLLPNTFFLMLPLGFLTAQAGMVLWLVALVGSMMASVKMLWILNRRPEGRQHLLSYVFAPVLACIMAGQIGIFLLLGVVLFFFLHRSRPMLAGAALLLCTFKPHLFLAFGLVLIAWSVQRKAYRVLIGAIAALLASCAFAYVCDPHAWTQYVYMMRSTAEARTEFIPTLSMMLRLAVDRNAVWLQFVPAVASCVWAIWYFWTRRGRWDWMNQGLLLLLVSEMCAPHAILTDEALALPAMLAAVYRADEEGRSLLPFGLVAIIALVEVMAQLPLASLDFIWTTPAWLAWYLYATRGPRTAGAAEAAS